MANTIEELESQKDQVQAQIKALVEKSAELEVQIEKARREKKLAFPVSAFVGKAFGLKSKEYKQTYALERWAHEHGYVDYKPLKETRKARTGQAELNLADNSQETL